MAAPPPSRKDGQQVLKYAFDDDTGRLRVDAVAVIGPGGISAADGDNIAISDGTDTLLINPDGSINTAIEGEVAIEISAADGDNIAISDGTNTMSVNPDGSINITDNGASITVDGTVTANQGTSPWIVSGTVVATPSGIQDVNVVSSVEIEIKNDAGNPIPVSGTVTANQGTSPWVIGDGGGSITVDGTVAATQSGTWNINNITGTVSLPTGAATEATLATRLADTTFTSRINTLGQKTSANSTPVVLASDQTPIVATTSSVTTFNATTTSATVLASNSSRKGASFYNDGGGVVYIKLGATASATSYTVRMPDNTFYELPYPTYTGVIDAVSAAGTRSVRVTELS